MIRSMTGFGRAVQEIDGYVITVELKSVNHRYFEFSSRVPRQYGFIEDKLKSFVNSRASRGKVDCFVGIEALNTEAAQVAVNHTLAGAYNTALQEIALPAKPTSAAAVKQAVWKFHSIATFTRL